MAGGTVIRSPVTKGLGPSLSQNNTTACDGGQDDNANQRPNVEPKPWHQDCSV